MEELKKQEQRAVSQIGSQKLSPDASILLMRT